MGKVTDLVETLEERHDSPLDSLLVERTTCAVHPHGLEGDCADNVDANGAGGDGQGRWTGGHARGAEEGCAEHCGRLGVDENGETRRVVVVGCLVVTFKGCGDVMIKFLAGSDSLELRLQLGGRGELGAGLFAVTWRFDGGRKSAQNWCA